ncbi:MAG: sugar transferase [Thermostichales cyanobacterium SZTDM-1c_bins_54]
MLETATDLRLPRRIRLAWGYPHLALILLLADVMSLALAWKIAERVSLQEPAEYVLIWEWQGQAGLFWVSWICYLLVGLAGGLYRFGDDWHNTRRHLHSLTLTYLGVLLFSFLTRIADGLPRSLFITAWGLSWVLVSLNRHLLKQTQRYLNHHNHAILPVLLIAHPQDQALISENWRLRSGYRVVATLAEPDIPDPSLLSELGIQEIQVTEPIYQKMSGAQLWSLRSLGYRVRVIPSRLTPLHPQGKLQTIAGIPTVEFSPPVLTGADFFVKRVFDFGVALVGLVLLSPLMLGIAVVIYLDDPGPIFYGGWRPGLGGRPFRMWKFRTMVKNAEALQPQLESQNCNPDGVLFKIPNDPRLTRVGRWLRRTSLDELPQLFNVLRGEMSLVGPRPLPMRDVERFQPWHHARHQVLPGITGLWQVRGRGNYVHFDEAIIYDLDYIQQWSIGLDIQLILETIWVVVRGKGAW